MEGAAFKGLEYALQPFSSSAVDSVTMFAGSRRDPQLGGGGRLNARPVARPELAVSNCYAQLLHSGGQSSTEYGCEVESVLVGLGHACKRAVLLQGDEQGGGWAEEGEDWSG